MTIVLRKINRIGMMTVLLVFLVLTGGGFSKALAADTIGSGVPGNWEISLPELKTLLDAEGHKWKELQTARDIRINVNHGMAGQRQLKYIFADGVLTTVQRNRTGTAFSADDFDQLMAAWEAELLENWDATEVMVREMEQTEDMLNARQIIITDGRRYVAVSAYRHTNDQVLGNVMYFNPDQSVGKELWQHCFATGSGFVKREQPPEPAE